MLRRMSCLVILFGLAGCAPDEGRRPNEEGQAPHENRATDEDQLKAQICKWWYDAAYGDTIDYTLILEPVGTIKWSPYRGGPEAEGTYRFIARDVMAWDLSYAQHPAKDQTDKPVARKDTLHVRIDHVSKDELRLTFLTTASPVARKGSVTLTSERPKG